MIAFQEPASSTPIAHSVLSFYRKTGVIYSSVLRIESASTAKKARAACSLALRNQQVSEEQRWLGTFFAPQIAAGFQPQVAIRWIDQGVGYGVFAAQPFKTQDFAGEYCGLLKRRRLFFKSNDYCFRYYIGFSAKEFVIDSREIGNYTRYLNHSDQPNLEALSVYADGLMHIIFRALKPIAVGEELTFNYGPLFWRHRFYKK